MPLISILVLINVPEQNRISCRAIADLIRYSCAVGDRLTLGILNIK
ncbi:MAG: hypothetical protein HC852_21740 [Acaryochloridaceae cyanobacterium RU_4_10]|nr:hypothetical protein [Acaryochloridaceae cyanobacterium RU_4_10]